MVGAGVRDLPKVVLHDHLDGGLRPATIVDLAGETGYDGLPTTDVAELGEWFFQGGSSSLERYLEAFRHTIGVMQTAPAIERVAFEAVEDLAGDGVVYAEIRMAPSLCTEGELSRQEAIEAMLKGFSAAESEFGVPTRLIVDAMRQDTDSLEVVEAALEYVDAGVVGFDLAGPEAGFPATDHRAACERAREGGLHLTIHAGEGAGVDSVAGALEVGAERIGHGARIVEDLAFDEEGVSGFGAVATAVHSRGLALEICPTSNVHTGMYPDAAHHPLGILHRSGFQVTLNTDNRLMSGIDPSDEFELAIEHQGLGRDDLRAMTLRAVDAAFCDEGTRDRVRASVEAGYS